MKIFNQNKERTILGTHWFSHPSTHLYYHSSYWSVHSHITLIHIPSSRPSGKIFHIYFPHSNVIFLHFPLQSIRIFFYIHVASSDQTLFNSDGIVLCQIYLSSLSSILNINYCILVCWRSEKSKDPINSEILINSKNGLSNAEKEKRKRAPKIPRYQQYRYPQSRVRNYILIL